MKRLTLRTSNIQSEYGGMSMPLGQSSEESDFFKNFQDISTRNAQKDWKHSLHFQERYIIKNCLLIKSQSLITQHIFSTFSTPASTCNGMVRSSYNWRIRLRPVSWAVWLVIPCDLFPGLRFEFCSIRLVGLSESIHRLALLSGGFFVAVEMGRIESASRV